MSSAIDYVRNNCGIAGEEVANYVDALESQIARDTALIEQLRSEVGNAKSSGWEDCETCHGIIDGKHVEAERLRAENAALKDQLETECVRLAACSTAAIGYFEGCDDKYRSAALNDVLRLRAENAALAAALVAKDAALERCTKFTQEDYDALELKPHAALVAKIKADAVREYAKSVRNRKGSDWAHVANDADAEADRIERGKV